MSSLTCVTNFGAWVASKHLQLCAVSLYSEPEQLRPRVLELMGTL